MKRSPLPSTILLSLMPIVFIASTPRNLPASDNESAAIFAKTAAEGGRLLITRSPTLGRNVTITLSIDGKLAGSLTWGRTYDKNIMPGRHILTASASRTAGAWEVTFDVRPGQTYSYSASYNVNRLVLVPRTR